MNESSLKIYNGCCVCLPHSQAEDQ